MQTPVDIDIEVEFGTVADVHAQVQAVADVEVDALPDWHSGERNPKYDSENRIAATMSTARAAMVTRRQKVNSGIVSSSWRFHQKEEVELMLVNDLKADSKVSPSGAYFSDIPQSTREIPERKAA